jgi:hypothetical protein
MKTFNKVWIIASFVLFYSVNLFSQSSGDFRSNGQGKWNATSTWQQYNGTSWVSASAAPTGSENITIQAPDSVDVNIPVTITGKIIGLGGKLGNSLTNLTFGTTGVYEHAVNAKSVPSAIWGTGSTCLFTGVKDTMPSNNRQDYYNFAWDCPNYGTSALNLGWGGNTIGGDVNILHGNLTKTAVRLTASNIGNQAPGANVITINGNINISDTLGQLTSTGSSSQDTIQVWVKGNITSQGIFNVANGSGCQCNWYISGDLILLDGSMTTNSQLNTLADSVFFVGTSKQTFYKADSLGSISNVQFVTPTGAIVDLVATSIGGSATTFTQASGSTLITSHKNGIGGNLSMQGKITLPTDGNYEYNRVASQIDTLLPATVNDLTINNPDTVSFSKPVTVNGVLTLKQGLLDNSVNAIIIGSTGRVVYAGGHAAVPIQGWPEGIKEVALAPREFKLYNNYPNPFNPSTQIRFSVPKDGFTSLKVMNILGQEVAILFEGNAKSGNMLEVTFNARNLSSGIYFARLQQAGKISIQKMNLIK